MLNKILLFARQKSILLGVVLFAAATLANGTVITFGNLPGPNGTPFASTTEGGFDVLATSSAWQQGFNVGNPTPSIFNFTGSGESILVMESLGSPFTFGAIDFGTGATSRGSYNYTLTGLLGAATQFVQTGAFAGTFSDGFATVASAFSTTSIDSLTLSISNFQISSVNVDNIVVSRVPEPATLALLGLGLLGLGWSRRKTKQS